MQVRILGPVDMVVDGRPRPVHGLRRKAVLSVLALHHGEMVSIDRIIDIAWSDTVVATTANTVQSQISHLRQRSGSKATIRAHPPGYVLDLGDDGTDVEVAERLVDEGRHTTDPTLAAGILRTALALWRGPSLADVTGLVWLDEQAERLDHLRWLAEQALIENRLLLGEHAELVPDLERLCREHPFDEPLHGQLMLALYRTGQQADALRTYQRMRNTLSEDLGIEPSPALRDLEAAILRQEPTLVTSAVPAAPIPVRRDERESAVETESVLAAGIHALTVDGQMQVSRQRFESAYRLAERAGDDTALARAALGLGGLWVNENRTATASALLRTRLLHALSVVDPRSSLGLRLRARLAGETDYTATQHGRILYLVAECRRTGDPLAHAEALSLAHHCLLGPDHGAQRQALALELIGESSRTGRPIDLLMGVMWHVVDLFLDADPHAERRLGELNDLLTDHDHLAVGFVADAIEVMLTIRAGRFDDALTRAKTCSELGRAAGDIDATGWHGAQLVAVRWFQGRVDELLPMLDELVYSQTLSDIDNPYFAAFAVAAAAAGDRRAAAGALARLSGNDLAELPRSSTWLVTMSGIAEAAHLLGDVRTAARAYELLSPYAHLPVMASLGVACFGSAHSALGVAAMTTGDLDLAVDHLHTAVRDNLAIAHWPAVLLSRRRHAQALTLRGQPGDAVAAEHELATAREEAIALGI
jgi:DNA-binding SARP family transcriptional activator